MICIRSPNVTSCMDFLSQLPVETVDVEVRITLMQGTHMFSVMYGSAVCFLRCLGV